MNSIFLYFKQAWNLMRQNRFYSTIYIVGTGLAITLVMIIAIVYHIKTADIAPEVHRSTMLVNERASAKKKEGGRHNWSLSYKTLKECYYNLKTPKLVTAMNDPEFLKYQIGDLYFSLPGSPDKYTGYMGCTDANFWHVFHFTFINGKPFNQAEFESGFRKAIICESLAKKIFGEIEINGKSMLINDVEYVVGGVVKDVSPTMTMSFANLWVPFTTVPILLENGDSEGIVGSFSAYILAHKTTDFDNIRAEIEEKRKQYNSTLINAEFVLDEGVPYTYKESVIGKTDFRKSVNEIIRQYLLIALVFLLVPAINLSGLTSSRMQDRISEIGIRKAFGARWTSLINQVLTENLLLTLLGGLLGLIISYIIVLLLGKNLLIGRYRMVDTDMNLSSEMFINLNVFFYAFSICVLLNLISSLIPVWNISRKKIVEAISDK